jgi:hypothetical protein
MQLRLNGAALRFEGLIARQRVQSTLACSFLPDSISPLEPPLSARTSIPPTSSIRTISAALEGKPLQLRVQHGLTESYVESARVKAWIAADGSTADLEIADANEVEINHWLFGPLLILALARRGVFCLHASSVLHDGHAFVIVGDSGAGKSSFARVLDQAQVNKRLTDDISPMTIENGRLLLLPRFPQLKLSQQITDASADYAVSGLWALEAAKLDVPGSKRRLRSTDLHFRLMRHTVASRLFSTSDARRWWEFAAAAQQVLAASDHNYQLQARHASSNVSAAMLELYRTSMPTDQ